MRKIYILPLVLGVALFSGCLGSTGDDIIGTWRLAPVDPAQNTVEMSIEQGGTLYLTDLVTLQSDTGHWELTPNIANHRLTISDIDPARFTSSWNAEWSILKVDETSLLIAAKGNEFGGVWQQDFVRQ
jgi:hypothetical protein